jgi:hypothetical protein
MHVGALVSRFADELDPRCELSVNSVERLQRWWRLAIPDLVSAGEGAEASPQLVERVDRLFG